MNRPTQPRISSKRLLVLDGKRDDGKNHDK